MLSKSEVKKFDAREKPAIFVGRAETSKAYKLIDFKTHKLLESRNVLFGEKPFIKFDVFFETPDFDVLGDIMQTESFDAFGLGDDNDGARPQHSSGANSS